MKRIVLIVLCCVMLVAALAGCGSDGSGAGNYESAFKAYMEAQENADTDAIIDLLPPDFYDYVHDYCMDRLREDPTDEAIKKSIETRYRPIVLTFDMAQPELRDADLVKDFTFSYRIEDTYKASSAELKEFNNYTKEYLGFENNAQEIVLIKYRYTLKLKGEVYRSNDDIKGWGVCVKMDGKWYYGDSYGMSSYMWEDRQGLSVNSCVQWIVDWFGQ